MGEGNLILPKIDRGNIAIGAWVGAVINNRYK